MENKDIVEITKYLIAHNKIKEAIKNLMLHTGNSENNVLSDRLIILDARYDSWEQKNNLNLIDDSYSSSFINRIIDELIVSAKKISEIEHEAKPIIELNIDADVKDFDNKKEEKLINSIRSLLGLKGSEIKVI